MRKITYLFLPFLLVYKLQAQDIGLPIASLLINLLNQKKIYLPSSVVTYLPVKEKRKELFKEIEVLNRAIYQYPDSAELRLQRGMLKDQLLAVDGAITDLNRAIELNLRTELSYFQLGKAYLHKGLVKNAIYYFSQVIKLNPSHHEAYFFRGVANLAWGTNTYKNFENQSELAVPDFERAAAIKPDYWEAYFMQGYARNIMEDYEGTLANYKQTLTINPGFHSLYILIGVAEVHEKNSSEAC